MNGTVFTTQLPGRSRVIKKNGAVPGPVPERGLISQRMSASRQADPW